MRIEEGLAMPPPGYEPFLKTICDNPDDDTVRLVYADWLEENGDPERAEFIRLQIAYPSRPTEFETGYARMEELRKRLGHVWRAELPKVLSVTSGQFRRGFIDCVTFQRFDAFTNHSADLLARTPACELRLCQAHAADIEALLNSPYVQRLTILRVNAGISGAEVVERLVATGWKWKLRELEISAWGPNPAHPFLGRPMIVDHLARLLARATVFPHLRALSLNGVSLGSAAYAELVGRFGKGLTTAPRMSS